MTFQQSVVTCLKKYFVFSGRASRSEFWWFQLFVFLINAILSALGFLTLQSLVGLALFMPGLAAACRRLHDSGRTGWWLLLILVPVVGWIILFVLLVLAPTDKDDDGEGSMALERIEDSGPIMRRE